MTACAHKRRRAAMPRRVACSRGTHRVLTAQHRVQHDAAAPDCARQHRLSAAVVGDMRARQLGPGALAGSSSAAKRSPLVTERRSNMPAGHAPCVSCQTCLGARRSPAGRRGG
jgi:hypothetical protein